MHASKLMPIALAMLLAAAGAAQAHISVSSDQPTGAYQVGDTFDVVASIKYHCTDAGPTPKDNTATITNIGDYAWLTATETTVSYDPLSCQPDVDEQGLTHDIGEVTITVTVTGAAPAFQDHALQPGLVGETNVGGDFVIQQAYDPAFTAPSALSVDSVAGGATATIPLTVTANADSVFTFDVTSFTFDGEAAPEGATAHIQETLAIDSPVATETGSVTQNVELHFGDHGGHEEGDTHEETEGEGDAAHLHWETAQAVVSITLAAAEDATQVSEAKNVVVTFVNTDAETMPHGDDAQVDEGDEDGFLKNIPGVGPVALIGAIGLLAVLRRRG